MANEGFNPDVGPEANTNWLGYSQGYTANKTIGNLFKGFAESADSALKAYDTTQRTNIALDASRKVTDITTSKPNEPIQIPEGLKANLSKIDKYRNALAQGVMSDLEFKVRLDKTAKEMRSKYGEGYRDVIDNSLANAQGVSTANQLRDEMLQAIKTEQQASDEKTRQSLALLNGNEEVIGTGSFQSAYQSRTGTKFNPADFDYFAAYSIISGIKAVKYQQEADYANLNFASKKMDVEEQLAVKVADAEINNITTSVFNDKAGAEWWKNYDEYRRQAADPNSPGGVNYSPEEQTQLRRLFSEVKLNAGLMVDQILAEKYSGTITSQTNKDMLKKNVLDRLDLYQSQLDNKEFGSFNIIVQENAAIASQAENDIFNDPLLGKPSAHMMAAQKIGWDPALINEAMQTATLYFNGQPVSGADARTKMLQSSLFGSLISNTSKPDSEKMFAAEAAGLLPEQNADLLQKKIDLVLKPEVTPALAAKAMESIYNVKDDQFIVKFYDKDPEAGIRLLASHEMTDKMYGTKTWEPYLRWLREQFQGVAIPASATLIGAQKGTDDTLVNFDGKRFSVELTNSGLSKHSAFGRLSEDSEFAIAKKQIDIMNTYLDALEYAYKKNGAKDIDITRFALSFFNNEAPQEIVKDGSFLTVFKKAIIRNIEESSATANSEKVTGGSNPKTR